FSPAYVAAQLIKNAALVTALVDLFESRFNPDAQQTEAQEAQLRARVDAELDQVSSLDADRVLRAFYSVVLATLRTNYYQVDKSGNPKAYVSIKLKPEQLVELPEPRPWVEAFVYAPS